MLDRHLGGRRAKSEKSLRSSSRLRLTNAAHKLFRYFGRSFGPPCGAVARRAHLARGMSNQDLGRCGVRPWDRWWEWGLIPVRAHPGSAFQAERVVLWKMWNW